MEDYCTLITQFILNEVKPNRIRKYSWKTFNGFLSADIPSIDFRMCSDDLELTPRSQPATIVPLMTGLRNKVLHIFIHPSWGCHIYVSKRTSYGTPPSSANEGVIESKHRDLRWPNYLKNDLGSINQI